MKKYSLLTDSNNQLRKYESWLFTDFHIPIDLQNLLELVKKFMKIHMPS